jgi:hypothetical protein
MISCILKLFCTSNLSDYKHGNIIESLKKTTKKLVFIANVFMRLSCCHDGGSRHEAKISGYI